jgi:hypothetical protein
MGNLRQNGRPLAAAAAVAGVTWCVLLLAPSVAAAGTTAFATDNMANLYRVDLSTGVATLIGLDHFANGGLAYDPSSGRLWGCTDTGSIHEINPNTGAHIVDSSRPTGIPYALETLDCTAPDTLWFSDAASPMVLRRWSTVTDSVTATVDTGAVFGGFSTARSLAFNPAGDRAYFMDDERLWQRDLVHPATLIGPTGTTWATPTALTAMDIDAGGTMWGLDASGRVGQVNLLTGAFTLTGADTGSQFWVDMTIIPEPSSFALFTVAFASAAARRRRRERYEGYPRPAWA